MQKICYFKKYVGIELYVYHLRYIQFTENIEIVITVGVEKCFSVEHIYKILPFRRQSTSHLMILKASTLETSPQ